MVNEGLTRKLAETVTLTVSVAVYILRYCWVEMSVLHALLWMPTAMMYNYSRKEVFSVIHGIQLRVLIVTSEAGPGGNDSHLIHGMAGLL